MRVYQQLKNIYHWLQSQGWRAYYRWPDRGLTLYGVTGTNGKTTTCFVVASILEKEYGAEKVGMLTTVAFRIGTQTKTNTTKMTTMGSRAVFRYLSLMKTKGVKHVVMEITSHALDQHRLAGLQFAGAIITNISREHLDYHKTMEAYTQAKGKIIGYLKSNAPLVGKEDDQYVTTILQVARAQHSVVIPFTKKEAQSVHTPLPGDVNKENVLAARKLAKAVGISEQAIEAGVNACTSVPGRMEWIESAKGIRVLVDYAVTPDSLEKLYQYVQSLHPPRIFGIIGAAGLRDRGKRSQMAQIISQYADEMVVTREDPWTESEEQIFSDLEQGLHRTQKPWRRIVDRKEALVYLIQKAGKGDIIVVTGKGAETGMAVGTTIIPWNEKEIIRELLAV